MGKKPGPSPEELEFIFECFTRGLSDSEVLDEMQDTELPVRNPRFIRDRRREFNAARKVLEDTLKQQQSPIITKVKEEHLADIRAFLQELRQIVITPKIHEIYLDIDNTLSMKVEVSDGKRNCLSDFESDPLFGCVKEHVPIPSLWQDFSSWQSSIHGYLSIFKELAEAIYEDVRVLKWMDEYPNREEKQLITPIFKCISDKSLGKEPELIQTNPDTGKFEPYLIP